MIVDHGDASPHLLGYSLLLGTESVQSEHSGVEVNKGARHVHRAAIMASDDTEAMIISGQDSPQAGHVIRPVVTAEVASPRDRV